jgi:acetolactate synthase-1/2/3 large subunit
MLDFQNENRIEQFGVYGNRGANFTVQNADLILSIGCRLDTRMTGSNPKQFAREAKKIIVDIDKNELNKGALKPDLTICTDARDFIISLLSEVPFCLDYLSWLKRCQEWAEKYKIEIPKTKMISPYSFIRALSEECKSEVVITDTGSNMINMYQEFKPKGKMFTAMGHSPMGYSICGAIGAGILGYDTVAVIGDGGIQMNIQEFQTIKNYNIPLKIFIFSNKGYCLIRQFQDLYMGSRHIGTEEGVPDFEKVAKAYGLKSMTISNPKKTREQIKKALKMRQVIVNVIMDPKSTVIPRAIFGKPIEEQHPYLSEKETLSNLIVKRWKKS